MIFFLTRPSAYSSLDFYKFARNIVSNSYVNNNYDIVTKRVERQRVDERSIKLCKMFTLHCLRSTLSTSRIPTFIYRALG